MEVDLVFGQFVILIGKSSRKTFNRKNDFSKHILLIVICNMNIN